MRWFILLSLACGCSGTDAESTEGPSETGAPEVVDLEELADEVAAPGPHGVGYRTVEVAWTDPLLTEGSPRSLRVSLWYPTDADDGADVLYQDVFPADDVLGDAPVAGEDLPVAVFSHGHQAYSEAASFLMEHLASHGWVVVAPDHLGNLTWDGGDRDTEIYLQRPGDLVAVLDWLDAPTGDELEGRLGAGRLGMGHSFGGYTLFATAGATFDEEVVTGCDDGTAFCSTMSDELADRFEEGFDEARFDALVAMDPGDHRLLGAGLAEVRAPVLYLSADFDDPERSESQPFWDDLDHPGDRWGAFPGLGHNGFTDVAGALDPPGVLPAETGWRLVRASVLGWGRAQLLEDASAAELLEPGSPLDGPDLVLEER